MEDQDKALRYNNDKIRYDLIEDRALEELAKVFTFGANKYAANNWLKGLPYSNFNASAKRHVAAFKKGEDYDKESGLHHLAHAAWNYLAIVSFSKLKPHLDDRFTGLINNPKIVLDVDDVLADFTGAYSNLMGLSERPTNWYFTYNMNKFLESEDVEKFFLDLPPIENPKYWNFEPIAYVSARKVSTDITKQWLEMNNFPCAEVIHVDKSNDKIKILKDLKADIFVDDKYDTFVKATNEGIYTLLYDRIHNRKFRNFPYDRRIYNLSSEKIIPCI